MSLVEGSRSVPIDVGQVLDREAWGAYQILVLLICGLVIIIDGIDNQLLGITIPSIMRDWNQPRPAFTAVLTAGFVGMMVGGTLAGVVGDRLGRRVALIGSVLVFALATIGSAFANSLSVLSVLRFLAGVGLQGATPTAAALVSEYAPLRHRTVAVTSIIVCFPLGASAAGLIAIPILPAWGWRGLFLVGGVLALLVTCALVRWLPESPYFLARHATRWPDLVKVLRRIGPTVPDGATFAHPEAVSGSPASVSQVFGPSIRWDTVALWSAFLFCLLAIYSGGSWIPTILTESGSSATVANTGIAAFNFGGVAGAIAAAVAIGRLGSKVVMVAMSVAAVVSALAMSAVAADADASTVRIVAVLGLTGGLINGVQTTMYALATHIYPTTVRNTGVGVASSVGRTGAILSPFVGNWAIELGGASGLFRLLAGAMFMVAGSLALVHRHVPPRPRAIVSRD